MAVEHLELRELQPRSATSSSSREPVELGAYQPAVDAGHIAFAAVPRAPPPDQVVVAAASSSHSPLEPPDEATSAAAEEGRQQSHAQASTSVQQAGAAGKGGSKQQRAGNVEHPLASADERPKGGSNASLESLGEDKVGGSSSKKGWGRGSDAGSDAAQQARSGARQQQRWPWQPRWREPRLLPVPVLPDCRPDDMHMSLIIGVTPLLFRFFHSSIFTSTWHPALCSRNFVCKWAHA